MYEHVYSRGEAQNRMGKLLVNVVHSCFFSFYFIVAELIFDD
jgi:hypothetical protein